jgi:nicotinamidase-related amidase
MESVINTATKMVRAAEMFNIGVVVTEQNPKGLGPTVADLDSLNGKNFLKVKCGKSLFSMCVPEVDSWLKQGNVESVVIFGIETHVCVTQTVLDLLDRKLNVYVLADGVSSVNQAEIGIALDRLRQLGAYVTTSESLLFQLQKDAGLENFKSFSGLIKEYKDKTKYVSK